MSSLIRGPDGKVKLYCKGADTVILERLSTEPQAFTEITLNQLEVRLLSSSLTKFISTNFCFRITGIRY